MKKRMIECCVVALMCALVGCQTRITAEKNPEQMLPVYSVASVGGSNMVYVSGYEHASGGWLATARSPLWANEQFAKLAANVGPDGVVSFGVDGYSRDLSTNAVTMAHNLVTDFALLAEKVGEAYATCGSSIIAAKGKAAMQKGMAKYFAGGGTTSGATCKVVGNDIVITDTATGVSSVCENCVPSSTAAAVETVVDAVTD